MTEKRPFQLSDEPTAYHLYSISIRMKRTIRNFLFVLFILIEPPPEKTQSNCKRLQKKKISPLAPFSQWLSEGLIFFSMHC